MSVFLGSGFLFRLLPKAPRWSRPKRHIKNSTNSHRAVGSRRGDSFSSEIPRPAAHAWVQEMKWNNPPQKHCADHFDTIFAALQACCENLRPIALWPNEEDMDACDGSHFDICPSAATSDHSPSLSLFDLSIRHQNSTLRRPTVA